MTTSPEEHDFIKQVCTQPRPCPECGNAPKVFNDPPTGERLMTCDYKTCRAYNMAWDTKGWNNRAVNPKLIAAAPVPPAGGEVESVAVVADTKDVCLGTVFTIYDAAVELPIGTELVDRAHVTRLQAEVDQQRKLKMILAERVTNAEANCSVYRYERDALKAEVERLKNECGAAKGEYDRSANKVSALQSELTKAQELLEDCLGPIKDAENNADCSANERLYHNLGDAIRAVLAHQSAPSAKGGSHTACGYDCSACATGKMKP